MAELDVATALLVVAQAAFIGVLMGVIGGGGGSVYVLVMTVFAGLPPVRAVATGVLLATCGSAAASWRHLRAGRVVVRKAIPAAGAGAVAAVLGGLAVSVVPERTLTVAIVAVFVVLGALPFVLPAPAEATAGPRTGTPLADVAVGGAVGIAVGAVGMSGGAPLASWFGAARRLPASTAVGTAMVVVTATSAVGGATHLVLGQVDWAWFGLLGAGAVLGAYAGAGLTDRIPQRPLLLTCGVLSMVTSLGLLLRL